LDFELSSDEDAKRQESTSESFDPKQVCQHIKQVIRSIRDDAVECLGYTEEQAEKMALPDLFSRLVKSSQFKKKREKKSLVKGEQGSLSAVKEALRGELGALLERMRGLPSKEHL